MNEDANVVIAVDRHGIEHHLVAECGQSVMNLLREAGLPIDAICGGCMSCATCHVYVDAPWFDRLVPAEDGETDLLTASASFERGRSRLACQIPYVRELSGLRIILADEN